MIDLDTLRGLAKIMAEESDEPSDLRGLRARAVAQAADEIERLRKELAETEEKYHDAMDNYPHRRE